MTKILATLTLTIGFISSLLSAPAEAKGPVPYEQFNYVCEYAEMFYGAECKGFEAPYIVESKVVSGLYYGFYYKGEPYIFINPRLSAKDRESTIVHETMHYVLYNADAKFSRCESEEAARRVHHLWEGTPYNDEWRGQYNC